MSWADANLNEDPVEALSQRIGELEHTITSQLAELRNEVGLAAATMRTGPATPAGSQIGDLEEQLARAVTVSLSAALERIREDLTEAVTSAVAHLSSRFETARSLAPEQTSQETWAAGDLASVAASLQHSVLLALSSFEQPTGAPMGLDPMDGPATARDVARVNQRIDELRALLLG